MSQPANAKELLAAFGPGAHHRFDKYAVARIGELHRDLEQAQSMDAVTRTQGAIAEIRNLQIAFKAFSEKS